MSTLQRSPYASRSLPRNASQMGAGSSRNIPNVNQSSLRDASLVNRAGMQQGSAVNRSGARNGSIVNQPSQVALPPQIVNYKPIDVKQNFLLGLFNNVISSAQRLRSVHQKLAIGEFKNNHKRDHSKHDQLPVRATNQRKVPVSESGFACTSLFRPVRFSRIFQNGSKPTIDRSRADIRPDEIGPRYVFLLRL